MIWHDLSHHVVVFATASANGARTLKTRGAGKIGLSGGCGAKKVPRAAKVFVEEKGNGRRGRVLYYSRDNDHCVVCTSLSSGRSLLMRTLFSIYRSLRSPHPSRCSLDTFSRIGEGFYCRAFVELRKYIAPLTQSSKGFSLRRSCQACPD